MSIGNIKTEGDLRRLIEAELRRPGARSPAQPAVPLIKNGAPSDSDFPNRPGNGIFAYDKEAGQLFVRVDGNWEAI